MRQKMRQAHALSMELQVPVDDNLRPGIETQEVLTTSATDNRHQVIGSYVRGCASTWTFAAQSRATDGVKGTSLGAYVGCRDNVANCRSTADHPRSTSGVRTNKSNHHRRRLEYAARNHLDPVQKTRPAI